MGPRQVPEQSVCLSSPKNNDSQRRDRILLHLLGRCTHKMRQKTVEKGKHPVEKIQKMNPVKTERQNCRFLSLVMVERVRSLVVFSLPGPRPHERANPSPAPSALRWAKSPITNRWLGTVSRLLFRNRELTEFSGKLGEFAEKLGEFASAHK